MRHDATDDPSRDLTPALPVDATLDAAVDGALDAGWHLAVFAMIYVAALLALSLSYAAFRDALFGAWPEAAALLAVSLVAGVGVKWLCEHRGELIEA